MGTKTNLVATGIALGLVLSASAGSAQTYSVTDLGTLAGDNYSSARAINASGEITGIAGDADTHKFVVFLYAAGKMKSLGTLGGSDTIGNGIDASGRATGYSGNRAFLYNGRKLKDIGDLGGGVASGYAIDRAGDVAGSSVTASGQNDPFLYRKKTKTMIDLGNLGIVPAGAWNAAQGINASGQITGVSWDGSAFFAFLWNNGQMQSLGTLGGFASDGYALNRSGQVTGYSYTGNGEEHAFLWSAGQMTDLGLISDSIYTAGLGINSAAEVVGYAELHNGAGYHAFVYRSGMIEDLNDLIPKGSGWILNDAYGVNDSGDIVGEGMINGQTHGSEGSTIA
ncbi:MAG: hypothetical protein ACREHF_08480 [Rhizomicrobium sp.]